MLQFVSLLPCQLTTILHIIRTLITQNLQNSKQLLAKALNLFLTKSKLGGTFISHRIPGERREAIRSHQRCSIIKPVLEYFSLFIGKHLYCSFFLISCGYCKIFKNTYFEEHLRTAASATTKTLERCYMTSARFSLPKQNSTGLYQNIFSIISRDFKENLLKSVYLPKSSINSLKHNVPIWSDPL